MKKPRNIRPCRHGHLPWMDDPFCPQCLREEGANDACDRILEFFDKCIEKAKARGACYDIIDTLAEGVRNIQSFLSPRGSGRAENPGSLDDLTALCPHCGGHGGTGDVEPALRHPCPHCGGKGRLDVKIADGIAYTEVCTQCKNHVGGCIVGGESPHKEVPGPKECPFCGGPTEYRKGWH